MGPGGDNFAGDFVGCDLCRNSGYPSTCETYMSHSYLEITIIFQKSCSVSFTFAPRQRLCGLIVDLSYGGFLAHRNPKESGDEPQILNPTRYP
jgi:hypothetical protein